MKIFNFDLNRDVIGGTEVSEMRSRDGSLAAANAVGIRTRPSGSEKAGVQNAPPHTSGRIHR